MGCAASSAKYAAPELGRSRRASHPELAEPDANAGTKKEVAAKLEGKRAAPKAEQPPDSPLEEPARTGSVDPVSPVDSPSPQQQRYSPPRGAPASAARLRASPSRTPVRKQWVDWSSQTPEGGTRLQVLEEESEGHGAAQSYTEEEIVHFGEALLGLDALKDRDLMWIAEEALRAPVPQGWVELADPASGVPYYYSTVDETTTWDHPLDGKYKLIAAQELENKRKKKSRMAEEQMQTQQPAAVTPAASAGAATPGSVASEEGESMSPAAERVRQTSKDLGTLKQLFAEGLLGEEVYAAKQEEVLRNCLSVLKPQPAADAAEASKDATTVRQAPKPLMCTTQLSTQVACGAPLVADARADTVSEDVTRAERRRYRRQAAGRAAQAQRPAPLRAVAAAPPEGDGGPDGQERQERRGAGTRQDI